MSKSTETNDNKRKQLPTTGELQKRRDELIEEFNTVQKAIEKAKEENQQRLGRISLLNELID